MTPQVWRLKGTLLRLTCPLFYRKIGRRTSFAGRIRFPMPFRNVSIGDDCMIGDAVFIQTGKTSTIEIGNNCSINSGCHIVASEKIEIGDSVAIGEFVSIRDQDHKFTPTQGVRDLGFKVSPIKIGPNCWIGRGVHICPGASIGSGSIVAANSVVKGVFPKNVLLAGAPAVIKRHINPDGSLIKPNATDK